MKLLGILLLLMGLFTTSVLASEETHLHQAMSIGFGMANIGVTENASTLVSTDEDADPDDANTGGESTAASIISMNINYEFLNYPKKSYFLNLVAPLLSSAGTGFFLGSVGVNFYMNSLSTLFSFNDQGSTLTMAPTLRYYWGGSAGIGYLVYNTESAKKSDVLFELGIHGGGIYNFKKDWGGKFELGLGRGTGVGTSTINMKLFLSVSYYIDK